MGILTIPCPGQLANGQPCSHRFWRLLPVPKICPTCHSPTSPGSCEKCGKPLQFGARVCTACAHVAPPQAFDEVVWSIPEGIFARRVDVTLKPGDNRRFLIPAGVAALTLIDGKPRVVPDGSIDYWTILRQQPTATTIEADRLRGAAEAQGGTGNAQPRLTVVLVRPGPYPLMLEFGAVPCADGVEMQVQIRAEASVRSVDLILRRFLSGETATVSTEEIERRVALEVQTALMASVSRRTMRDLLEPGARLKILGEVRDEASSAVADMGLELSSLAVVNLFSEATKEVLEERAGAAAEALQVETLGKRIANDLARKEALLDHADKLETLEQKRKFLLLQAVTREADVDLHSAEERERVARRLRQIEQALKMEQSVSDADLADLVAARSDKAKLDATLRGLELRGIIRGHELAEVRHALSKQIEQDRYEREKMAALQAAQRAQIQIALDAAAAALEIRVGNQRLDEEGKDKAHQRERERQKDAQDHEARMIQLKASFSKEQLMVIEKVSPELANAIMSRDESKPADQVNFETFQRVSEEAIRRLTQEIERNKDANKDALSAIVEAVRAARGGSQGTTNVNLPGRGRA